MSEDEKDEKEEKNEKKPKQRHRLLVNPEELGLTGRIRKALLEREMGLTQKIRMAVSKAQDKESPWHLGKYQMVSILVFFLLTILFGYCTFRSREIALTLVYPDGLTKLEQVMPLAFYQGKKEFKIGNYPRKVSVERNDIYSADFGSGDYKIFDKDGKEIKDGLLMPDTPYTLKIEKKGHTVKGKSEQTISIDPVHVKYYVELEPEEIKRRPLKMTITDPLQKDKKLEPDRIKLRSEKYKEEITGNFHNIEVRAGEYSVVIEKAGYAKYATTINVQADGTVKEAITLEPESRNVKFLVNDDLREIWMNRRSQLPEIPREEIALTNNITKEKVDFQGLLKPGEYSVEVNRPGYKPQKVDIFVEPGSGEKVCEIPMVAKDRPVTINLHYKFTPANANPDKAYLQTVRGEPKFFHLFRELQITPQVVRPGEYRLLVEKANFLPHNELIFVEPADSLKTVEVHLVPKTVEIILQIITDYDVMPLVKPDVFEINMHLEKLGYEPVPWDKLKSSLPPEKEQIEVQAQLITIPREVRPEINSDLPGKENELMMPDTMTLTKLKGGEKVGETINLVSKGKFQKTTVKPAYYELFIQHTGCDVIRKPILIEPHTDPIIIREKLTTRKVPLVLKLDSSFEPGVPTTADRLTLKKEGEAEAQPIAPNHEMKPGRYTLTMEKRGHYPLVKDLDVVLGSQQYVLIAQFQTKSRELRYNILGEGFAEIKKPGKVTMNDLEVRELDKIVPKPTYRLEIQAPGYKVYTGNIKVDPSDEPYTLHATLEPVMRKVIFEITATFPRGPLALDKCTLGGETIRGTEYTIKPKKDPYPLYCEKTGYEVFTQNCLIEPSDDPYRITVVMNPMPRPANVAVAYKVPSREKPTPKIRLVSKDKTIQKDLLEGQGGEVIPEDYTLTIEAPGYDLHTEEIRIDPANAMWDLKRELTPTKRTVLITLKADYPPDTEILADQALLNGKPITQAGIIRTEVIPGEYTLLLDKAGYRSISSAQFFIPAGVGEYKSEQTFISKEREVVYDLRDVETGQKLIPDKITLDGIPVSQQAFFKPKKYEFKYEVQGYVEGLETLEIPAGEGQFPIERRLVPSLRLVKYNIKGPFGAIKPEEIKEITLNGKPVDGKTGFKPGDYRLVVYVPGYMRRTEDLVRIAPSRDEFIIERTLEPKNRKVNFNITSSFPPKAKLDPVVKFGEKPVTNGEELMPQAGYQVLIEKEGYVSQVKTVDLLPSENDFELALVLEARPRKVEFDLDSDHEPNVPITDAKITFIRKGDSKQFDASQLIPPEVYIINIEKAGFALRQIEETIYPGTAPHKIRQTLVAKPRPVEIVIKSGFDHEIMEPKVLLLSEKPAPPGSMWKPGAYTLKVQEPGYQICTDTVKIPPGEDTYIREYELMPNNRKIIINVTYDVPPGDFPLPAYTVHLANQQGTLRVSSNDEIAPAEYRVQVAKPGYETIVREGYIVFPGEGQCEMNFQLIANPVQILMDITYDVQPPPDIKPIVVSLIDKDNVPRVVEHGHKIKPGKYLLEIAQDGYEFKTPKKSFPIDPRTSPVWIKEQLQARPRKLSFDILYRDPTTGETRMVRAHQILVDHRPVTPDDTFAPGKKYNVIATFEEFKKVEQNLVIPPGAGAYVVPLDLVKLEPFELLINEKYVDPTFRMILDDISMDLEIYADADLVEPQQMKIVKKEGSLIKINFYAPKTLTSLRVCVGFYNDRLYKPPYRFTDLKNMDVDDLISHLDHLASAEGGKIKVLSRMENLLQDSQDQKKILRFTQEEKEKLANFLRGERMTLPAGPDHERKVKIVKEVLKGGE